MLKKKNKGWKFRSLKKIKQRGRKKIEGEEGDGDIQKVQGEETGGRKR